MTQPDFEAALREQLVATVADRTPGEAPYEAIRQQGRAARRRRTAVVSAGVVVLTVLSGATLLAARGPGDTGAATGLTTAAVTTPTPTPSTPTPSTTPTPTPTPTPTGPQPPASAAQLADGITFEQAATALGQCLDYDRQMQARWQSPPPSTAQGAPGAPANRPPVHDPGALADYRVLLAVKSTGDDNSPGDGISVVGVSQGEHPSQIICHQVGGKTSGIQAGSADPRAGGPAGLVNPDINGGKLYRQAMLDGHDWKLPYRWGSIGTYAPSVARVTVSYGDGPAVDAALDHGWFAATGVLANPVTRTPHLKGYDGGGKLVYDSDDDKGYPKEL